ncbi:hypothetical protein [Massilia sp. METH4]|uniref:hypothetical protein n=1 Tax=Massilia sp. METH4 TaxID=3123041 RepID=UPI0030D252AA
MSSDNVIENDPVASGAGLRSEGTAFHTERGAGHETVEVRQGAAAPEPALSGTGFTYRHDWGPRRGQWRLSLNWTAVGPQSHVFVSIGEGAAGGPDAGKFVGSARYTLHNVAPRPGGVDIWVDIEWGSDIPLYVDYLVVNPPVLGTRTVSVTVHRHNAVTLTDADADRILADMGTVLQGADSGGDIATRVQFVRNGAVRVLPATVPGTIQTQADWNTLMGAGTGVKVVQAIRWCGGPGGSIIGCAPVGNPVTNLAVVRFTANMEGILWVHEYGHNAGNGHRTDDTRAVMFPSIGADHNVVDATESGRYLAGPLAGTGALMASGGCSCQGQAVQRPADVRAFVSQHWIEGIPYAVASQYGEEDARRLLEWLVNEPEKHEEFLPEIVTTLCYIGSEIAVQPLIDFVESRRAGQSVFNAKNAALIHLGDLANASGSKAAVEFLAAVASDMEKARALASPQASMAAVEATVAGVAVPTVEALGAELAVSATFGLALAGQAEAEGLLGRLRSHDAAFASVNLAAAEAVELAKTVRARGQKEYYRMKAEHGQTR